MYSDVDSNVHPGTTRHMSMLKAQRRAVHFQDEAAVDRMVNIGPNQRNWETRCESTNNTRQKKALQGSFCNGFTIADCRVKYCALLDDETSTVVNRHSRDE